MKQLLNIAIVGGGFAGSAAALFLHRAGHQVTLYEAVDDPQPVGAGILLQPTGMYVMEQLGLLDAVIAHGAVVDRLRCRTTDGRTLFRLAYAKRAEGLYGLGLHRGVLFEVLFNAALADGVDVRCGHRIVDVVGGGMVVDDTGAKLGPHDLVVVADGARSQIRASDFPAALDAPYPWGALWFVAEDPDRIFRRELFQMVEHTTTMLGFLPTGRAPGGTTNLTSIFWSLEVKTLEQWQHRMRFQGIRRFTEMIARLVPQAEPLVDQIRHPDQVLFAAYRDVRLRRWFARKHGTPVVVIGDAAHAMSPQLGQGSNLALYDAMVLARSLEGAVDTMTGLAAYQRARGSHLGFYGRVNRWVTPFFQGHSKILGFLRDVGFPIASNLPILHHAMVDTMAGVRRGFVYSESLPLPTLPPPRDEE